MRLLARRINVTRRAEKVTTARIPSGSCATLPTLCTAISAIRRPPARISCSDRSRRCILRSANISNVLRCLVSVFLVIWSRISLALRGGLRINRVEDGGRVGTMVTGSS